MGFDEKKGGGGRLKPPRRYKHTHGVNLYTTLLTLHPPTRSLHR